MTLNEVIRAADQPAGFLQSFKMRAGMRGGIPVLFVSVLLLGSGLTAHAQISPINSSPPPNQLPTVVNVLHAFSPATNYAAFVGYTNWDGAFCAAPLVQGTNGELYGVTPGGGDFGGGTVFSLSPNGGDFIVLHAFTQVAERSNPSKGIYFYSNADGNDPTGLLPGLDGKFYGTTATGGTYGYGAIFTLNEGGSSFTNLHSFAATDGESPQGGLVQGPDGTLYGTAENGGTNGSGTVFSLRPDGSGFTVLYNFTPLISGTNMDGAQPCGGLILSGDGTLYGTASGGGPSESIQNLGGQLVGSGTIFSLKTNGTDFSVLHAFDKFVYGSINPTNNDGASPRAALLLGTDGKLYGTAPEAGAGASGTIFCLCTNGSHYTVLHTFDDSPFPPGSPYFGYGLYPSGGLIQGRDGILYGVAFGGGLVSNGGYFAGTLYRLNPDGSGLVLLHSFAGLDPTANTNADGANSTAALLQTSGGTVYGLTSAGGINGSGTIFSFTPPVVLQVAMSNDVVALSWPATATNFALETSDTLSTDSAWAALTNSSSTGNNAFSWQINGNKSAAFFRLHRP